MNTPRVLYHMVRADFLERTRRYSFLVTVGLTMAAGYVFVPAVDASYVTVDLGGYRGVYNSAWIGGMVAILATTLVTLPGFYLVKNAVERDERSGVGQIIATTPLSRPLYTLGKWLSDLAVLATMVGILAVTALVMQLARGEVAQLDLWALLAPFLLVALPAMAVVAALAVWFETVRWLRGGLGNVVYFFVWMMGLLAALAVSMPGALEGGTGAVARVANDPLGLGIILPSMITACRATYPGWHSTAVSIGIIDVSGPLQLFRWDGVAWTAGLIVGRGLWVAAALGLALVAALPFGRFDPARERRRAGAAAPEAMPAAEMPAAAPGPAQLTALPARPARAPFGAVLAGELRLLLKRLPWWWHAVAAGLALAGLLAPLDVARRALLPAAWLWPILVWSSLGCREARHDTQQLVFSAPHPLARQLPATWLAGVSVAALSGAGVALRLGIAGDGVGLAAWGVGVLFIPSLALAAGTWSGSGKLFEAVYTLLWYAGPVSGAAGLDYMGALGAPATLEVSLSYLAATVLLLAAAIAGRRRQLAAGGR